MPGKKKTKQPARSGNSNGNSNGNMSGRGGASDVARREAERVRVLTAIQAMYEEAAGNGALPQQPAHAGGGDDDEGSEPPQWLFSDEERAAMERAPPDEALTAVAAIKETFEPLERKSFDLAWLGRRCVADVEADPSHPSHSGVVQVLANHPEEAEKIANGDAFEHGYHTGMMAACRLVLGLASTEWTDFSEGTDDPGRPWMSPEAARRQALEDFPMLDT